MIRDIFNNDIQIKNGILGVLNHYSAYLMPLKAEEIYNHLPVACAFSEVLVGLVDLEENHIIYNCEGFFSLRKDVSRQVSQRKVSFN